MTAHDSGGAYREMVPSFLSAGEVTLTINWDPNAATHKNAAGGLRKLFADRASSSFAIAYPVTPVAHDIFTAYVTGFEPSAPFDDKLTARSDVDGCRCANAGVGDHCDAKARGRQRAQGTAGQRVNSTSPRPSGRGRRARRRMWRR